MTELFRTIDKFFDYTEFSNDYENDLLHKPYNGFGNFKVMYENLENLGLNPNKKYLVELGDHEQNTLDIEDLATNRFECTLIQFAAIKKHQFLINFLLSKGAILDRYVFFDIRNTGQPVDFKEDYRFGMATLFEYFDLSLTNKQLIIPDIESDEFKIDLIGCIISFDSIYLFKLVTPMKLLENENLQYIKLTAERNAKKLLKYLTESVFREKNPMKINRALSVAFFNGTPFIKTFVRDTLNFEQNQLGKKVPFEITQEIKKYLGGNKKSKKKSRKRRKTSRRTT